MYKGEDTEEKLVIEIKILNKHCVVAVTVGSGRKPSQPDAAQGLVATHAVGSAMLQQNNTGKPY